MTGALLALALLASEHAPSAYLQAGAQVYLGPGRTAGGLGGGAGVRDVYRGRFVGQLDASWLVYLGNAFAVRAGAGVQRDGTWAPMALVTGTVWLGSQVRFSTPAHPGLASGPGLSAGLALSPLRFRAEGAELSVLELGLGLGWDRPGLARTVQVQVLQVALGF